MSFLQTTYQSNSQRTTGTVLGLSIKPKRVSRHNSSFHYGRNDKITALKCQNAKIYPYVHDNVEYFEWSSHFINFSLIRILKILVFWCHKYDNINQNLSRVTLSHFDLKSNLFVYVVCGKNLISMKMTYILCFCSCSNYNR